MRALSGPPFRAEHIGSLLRPPELLRAREQHTAGQLDRDALAAIENDAIARVVKLQEDIGLKVVTDGEFRRGTYSDSFTSAGISGVRIEMTEDQGWTKSQSHGHRMARRIPAVVGRIAWNGPQNAHDFRFLKSLTTRTPKITCPALATFTIAPAAPTSVAMSIPIWTRSGPTWSKPIRRKCARWPRPAAAICRSTRPRW
jgi:5-methyltetrahydropteroyltriglutamate--homocysteine methyltransferase